MAPLILYLYLILSSSAFAFASHDYGQALSHSILFFEAQRSGYLPSSQRVTWRGDSGLLDGKSSGVDLVGGYYDAGDNVKFGLPMAFTLTMMSWSIAEYERQMDSSGELGHALEALKWGTDYLIKAHPHPNVLFGEVGDGNTDHYCWQRPEDMTTDRHAYKIDVNNPGSDLAGETAAAMAAASVVFRHSNPSYSNELLTHAKQLFEFADKYRGKYDSTITLARKYYQSFSGYDDELLWAAAWLYQATDDEYYLNYLANNGDSLGGTGWAMTEFGWDVKYAGAQVLAAKFLMQGKAGAHSSVLERYQQKAEYFMCNVDYILGDNPRATSYMVGYGSNYPKQVHHRASSIVSIKVDSSFVSCRGGYATWYGRKGSDPNLLNGAVVGGPDAYDNFVDERDNYEQTEPATYNNAPLLGVLARLNGGHSGNNQLLPVVVHAPKPKTTQPAPAIPPKSTPVPAESSGLITVQQKMTTSWVYKGRTYYRYSTMVTNKSAKTLKDIKVFVAKLYGPLWGLTRNEDSYGFPEWMKSLPAGKSLEFVYIHPATPADISISSYTLV
ncbi:hypothetical protein Syun_013394 [Stephania yunnanensis]|uniref:Endoglucanase n=1 Tax=Stephania yunnanensis TaxID=152371 RepID=A0AAP0PIJ8_9MAGN